MRIIIGVLLITSEIDDAIQDYEDDETFDVNGYVDYTPYSSSASTASPIQTPSGLTKALSGFGRYSNLGCCLCF